jgi:uncharacterized protein (TIGR00297 family)
MDFQLFQLLLGLLGAGGISLLAYRFSLLTRSGALAAASLGTVVFGLGGLRWAIVLLVFFLTSSGLSFFFRKRKEAAEEKYATGATRDAGQVIANGGVAGLAVILHFFFPLSPLPWIAFCAAFAAATADTWATELGALSNTPPRLITTMKQVEAGTSGAVSWLGMSAAILGAMAIGLAGALFDPYAAVQSARYVLTVITIGGIAGSLVDSWLGATLQGIYFCPECQKETEKTPKHWCGAATELLRGKHWLNNDLVNLFCTLSGTLTSLLVILFTGA